MNALGEPKNQVERERWTRPMPGGWWPEAALVVTFALLTAALVARTPLLRLDVAVADWCDAHRPYPGYLTARVFNFVGQGGLLAALTLCLAGWLAFRRRSIRPVLVTIATYLLLGCVVLPLKMISDREAPHASGFAHPERLFVGAGGASYVAIAIVLGPLLPRRLWPLLLVGPPTIIIATTTYLGYHWITDDVAGVLIGVIVARVLLRVRWDAVPLGGRLARSGWDRSAELGPPT